jgi:ABC-2 type transport system permease protein
VCGFFFWFSFYAAVAAITDDPNSSSRPMLLFLPFLPAGLLMPLLENPNTPAFQVLSFIPLSSPVVLPVRLVLGAASAGEAVLAIGLLIGATLVLRRVAGVIFELGMLMYGKEPSWSEVFRWLRAAFTTSAGSS